MRAVVGATLRTNAFAPAAAEALAFKIDSKQVPGLPAPIPYREIWVYSPRVEGIHLRGGPIARGGLRWSDRRDDFRTEILGLMKAQLVKNAVIVPTGAKGGFYAKQLPNPAIDRDAWLAEGTESYRIFIRALLSVTDNIVDEEVVHPADVVIHDGEDPYFVVAADKGTATFSDVANAIALERNFWLGDAFASGGSNGYDHKAMGITAKGAWISVQRHFLESGIDVQTDSIRVVGCGDMSGDVFGNGMLLSKELKLVAAFDHRHIFIDPDPDPATSWAERKRLFDLPRSSWDDYDRKKLSKGAMIVPRSQKSIDLTPEARAALGIDVATIDPSTPDLGDPQGAGRPDLVRRHRHLHQGVIPDPCPGRRSGQRCAARRCARRSRQGHRRRRQPGHQPGRADRVCDARRAHQHRLHRQYRRASIVRTMRSTSRSRSIAKCARGG